jgi:hypothetical protein
LVWDDDDLCKPFGVLVEVACAPLIDLGRWFGLAATGAVVSTVAVGVVVDVDVEVSWSA